MAQNKLEFIARVGGKILRPKGFYYQGKYIILVGDFDEGHTIRRKELASDVKIEIEDRNPFPIQQLEERVQLLKSAEGSVTEESVPVKAIVEAALPPASKGMELVKIYRFQMESIVDSLRLTSNIHHSSKGATCFDRGVRQAYEYGKNALDGNIDLHVSYITGKVEGK